MKISVIGCGYLGAVHAATLASLGHEVTGVDTDANKVDHLSRGFAPFYEPGLEDLLRAGRRSGALRFSTDFSAAAEATVHFLCVGTPQSKTSDVADLSHLQAAMASLLPQLKVGDVVVGKSTVPVGTTSALQLELAAVPGVAMGWNPEFLRQGTAVRDSLVPDRLVYGVPERTAAATDGATDGAIDKPDPVTLALDAVYRPLLDAGVPRLVVGFRTAELIKSAANAFLATKVSFINAMAQLCESSGADVTQLAAAMGLDPRIGGRYLQAGLGFGGGCLPKDLRSFRAQAGGLGVESVERWMRLVDTINLEQRRRTVQLSGQLCDGDVGGRQITVLGAAFKPDTDDVRDSPAIDVAVQLAAQGAHVTVTDPRAINTAWMRYPQLRFESKTFAALDGADLVLLLTEWDEYVALDPHLAGAAVRRRVVLDARNALPAGAWTRAGWTYRGLGIGAAGAGTGSQEPIGSGSGIGAAGPGSGFRLPVASGSGPH